MIGVAVIGFGYWGPNLVRNFAETPGARVVAVCDLRQERLAKVQARYPTIKTTNDYRELLTDPAVDAIVIATPVASHFELAMDALRVGKHVLVEKPLASTVEQALRLVDEAECRNRILMVDHTFVYTGAVSKIKEIVDQGILGPIYYFDSVRVNLGLFQSEVNVLWDLAVHDLSIMDYVLDVRPCAVAAVGAAHIGKMENIAYLTCFFESNLIAHFHVSWLAPVKVRRSLIGGAQKMIVYDDLEPSEKVKVYDKGITLNGAPERVHELLVGYRMGDMWAPQLKTAEALNVEALHFVQCIEQNREPLTNGRAGLRIVHVLETAMRSLSQRGQPIELEWERISV